MSDSQPPQGDAFDVEQIRVLVELMEQHDLTELDIKQADRNIRLCRGATNAVAMQPMAMAAPAAAPAAGDDAADDPNLVIIKAPMVGTYYCRPNPNAEPFVRIGDSITAETTVCIIEAMKVFNEIPAEISGKIVAILVDDEEPVEFGKPLFKIDTSAK